MIKACIGTISPRSHAVQADQHKHNTMLVEATNLLRHAKDPSGRHVCPMMKEILSLISGLIKSNTGCQRVDTASNNALRCFGASRQD